MSKQTDISKAAAALGKRGGQAGTGKAKARSKEFYSEQGNLSGYLMREIDAKAGVEEYVLGCIVRQLGAAGCFVEIGRVREF